MVPYSKIENAAKILAEAARPEKIILFGSYARGEAREDSDVDFLVIEREPVNKAQEMVRLRRALRPLRIPVDVLVCSVADIARWATYRAPGYTVPCEKGRCCMSRPIDLARHFLALADRDIRALRCATRRWRSGRVYSRIATAGCNIRIRD
jgi:predicted nucleotidyltransferase